MKPYIGIVHQDRDSAYGITFPDAPGCFSAADSLDDLFDRAEEALGLWLDGMAEDRAVVPDIRELSEIKVDPDWAASFAEAAMVIAVPAPGRAYRAAA